MKKISDEIKAKQQQISSLEKQMPHSLSNSQVKVDKLDLSPVTFYHHLGLILYLSEHSVYQYDGFICFAVLRGTT